MAQCVRLKKTPWCGGILTCNRGEPFSLPAAEVPLLNRGPGLHGTPLYAALLDHAFDV